MNNSLLQIEKSTLKLIKSVDCKNPPVCIEKIAEKVGLKVFYFEFDDRISGVLKKSKGVIGVNKNHPLVRQRFSISHELGHYLLGHDLNYDEKDNVDEKFDLSSPNEKEANQFASALLMPDSWLKSKIDKEGVNLKKLAKEFLVSEQAITIRLLQLNLIR